MQPTNLEDAMLGLDVELRLEARHPDRVVVSVWMCPTEQAVDVDGVALQLLTDDDEPLGARMLLPIAGRVEQQMRSTVELRSVPEMIPVGCRVLGSAWRGCEQVEVTIPCDPGTAFEAHVRGQTVVSSQARGRYLEPLLTEEREAIARCYPWVDEPRIPRTPAGVLEVVDHEPEVDEMVDDLGLDEASAEWLKELLDDPSV
jgi:hypothetical protein